MTQDSSSQSRPHPDLAQAGSPFDDFDLNTSFPATIQNNDVLRSDAAPAANIHKRRVPHSPEDVRIERPLKQNNGVGASEYEEPWHNVAACEQPQDGSHEQVSTSDCSTVEAQHGSAKDVVQSKLA